ncbi:hypothetical protein PG995_001848 [Apiospora arundinis]|uniref:Uncharacterized protein n=1 Tax=Apiospora arundinis TaxID=335852 RepID=A0ABR2J797_9PEZI
MTEYYTALAYELEEGRQEIERLKEDMARISITLTDTMHLVSELQVHQEDLDESVELLWHVMHWIRVEIRTLAAALRQNRYQQTEEMGPEAATTSAEEAGGSNGAERDAT